MDVTVEFIELCGDLAPAIHIQRANWACAFKDERFVTTEKLNGFLLRDLFIADHPLSALYMFRPG